MTEQFLYFRCTAEDGFSSTIHRASAEFWDSGNMKHLTVEVWGFDGFEHLLNDDYIHSTDYHRIWNNVDTNPKQQRKLRFLFNLKRMFGCPLRRTTSVYFEDKPTSSTKNYPPKFSGENQIIAYVYTYFADMLFSVDVKYASLLEKNYTGLYSTSYFQSLEKTDMQTSPFDEHGVHKYKVKGKSLEAARRREFEDQFQKTIDEFTSEDWALIRLLEN